MSDSDSDINVMMIISTVALVFVVVDPDMYNIRTAVRRRRRDRSAQTRLARPGLSHPRRLCCSDIGLK